MNDPSAPPPRGTNRWEHSIAFLLVRLFIGLQALVDGLDKFQSGGVYSLENYDKNMTHMAEGITGASFLPLWMAGIFAHSLGYLLLGLGAALLLGLKTRITLALTGLLYIGLAFGLMAVQESDGVAWLAIYIGLIAGGLVLVRHERFALWPNKFD